MTTVSSGQTQYVYSGQTVSDTLVLSGGTEWRPGTGILKFPAISPTSFDVLQLATVTALKLMLARPLLFKDNSDDDS